MTVSAGRRSLWIRRALLALFVTGVASTMIASAFQAAAPEEVVTANAEVTQVHALGRLEPSTRILRVSAASGNEGACVQQIQVVEGQTISAGEVLAVLDNFDRRQATLDEAEMRAAVAEAKLTQILAGAKQGEIEARRIAVKMLSGQIDVNLKLLERARSLHTGNALTNDQLDARKWTYERSELELAQAEQELAAIAEVRESDVAVARAEVSSAKAAVRRARADLAAAEVRSPCAGRVLVIHTRQGERINDKGLLEMGDVHRIHAVAEVFEGDLSRLQIGQKAIVTIDSTGEKLTATVVELGHVVARKAVLTNDPVSDTDARVVEVRAELQVPPGSIMERLSNARVEVTFQLNAR
jgi:HlyD family secretion protein